MSGGGGGGGGGGPPSAPSPHPGQVGLPPVRVPPYHSAPGPFSHAAARRVRALGGRASPPSTAGSTGAVSSPSSSSTAAMAVAGASDAFSRLVEDVDMTSAAALLRSAPAHGSGSGGRGGGGGGGGGGGPSAAGVS